MLNDLITAVRYAGRQLLTIEGRGNSQGVWIGTQFKASADQIIDRILQERLRAISTCYTIVSEEDESSLANVENEEYFLIDPIDGTASYAEGYDGFVVQVAFVSDGAPCMAVVYQPLKDLLFSASRGQGAWLNGESIRVRGEVDEIILTDNYPEPRRFAGVVFQKLENPCYLESGSIGLKMCLVAAGRADLFVKDVMCKTWDVAAGALILSEAGGVASDIRGDPFSYHGNYMVDGIICARSKSLHQRVQEYVFTAED